MSWGYKKFVICPAIEGKHYPTDTENKLLNTVKVCPIQLVVHSMKQEVKVRTGVN